MPRQDADGSAFLADSDGRSPVLQSAKAAAGSASGDWVPWIATAVGALSGGAAALTQTQKVQSYWHPSQECYP